MKRAEVAKKILGPSVRRALSWDDISTTIGGASKMLAAAVPRGRMMTKEQADKAAGLFNLGKEEALLPQEVPYRGSLPELPPADPLIYRVYELAMVNGTTWGTTWKELIQEEFGDGIVSAIDSDMTLERQPDQKGDRVKVGMCGKFLTYKTY